MGALDDIMDLAAEGAAAGGCCPGGALGEVAAGRADRARPAPAEDLDLPADPAAYVRQAEDGTASLHLLVRGMHCAGCIRRIEDGLAAVPGIVEARVNMSTRRLVARWRDGETEPTAIVAAVERLGYPCTPFDPQVLAGADRAEERALLRAMAVAGFAAGNVMLLSVSVWSGAGSEGDGSLRDLFHWISALIAMPTVAYAGRPFFRSALTALRARGTNMDVPISLAVILATGMSLAQTMSGAQHVYFDAAIGLLFFLLIGRYLDSRARGHARASAEQLLALAAGGATVELPDGSRRRLPPNRISAGMTVVVAAGERIAVDGAVIAGRSDVDSSLVTGETIPATVGPGDPVHAGMVNLAAPLRLRVTAAGEGTLLSEIVRLMEAAEQGRARFVRLADRVARRYAPVVHGLALLTFLAWWLGAGAAWDHALMVAIAVLIITCPCALGLAVPAVQVVATGLMLRLGVILKAGDALERLAQADHAVLDKTGTLTEGRPVLETKVDPELLRLASGLAGESRHPLSRALTAAGAALHPPRAEGVEEVPGEGLAGVVDGVPVRIGRAAWCGGDDSAAGPAAGPVLWLRVGDRAPARLVFTDPPRVDAAETVAALRDLGLEVEILSGDRPEAVAVAAQAAGVGAWRAAARPGDKVARLEELAAQGRRVLMVGDGLNDAPALAAGYVSMSPASAADISQTAADLVFQGRALIPVAQAIRVARASHRHVRQNILMALLYNVIAVPVAVAGFATPLVAAVAMSSSSLIVTGNALRLRLTGGR